MENDSFIEKTNPLNIFYSTGGKSAFNPLIYTKDSGFNKNLNPSSISVWAMTMNYKPAEQTINIQQREQNGYNTVSMPSTVSNTTGKGTPTDAPSDTGVSLPVMP